MQSFMLSPDLVELEVEGRTAVYHRQLGGLCLLDAGARDVLSSFKSRRSIPPEWISDEAPTREVELIQQLIARKLIDEMGSENTTGDDLDLGRRSSLIPADRKPPVEKKVNIIQLVLANACNLGCTYCFEGIQGRDFSVDSEVARLESSRLNAAGEIRVNLGDSMYASRERLEHQSDPKNRRMKPEDAVRYVELALEAAKSSGVQQVMVQFFGGEPFLNWKAIKAVLDRFGDGALDEVGIQYSTVTNGSLLSDEIAQTLAQHRVAVCVSFDSPKSPNRPFKNGQDSTPTVMRGLLMLKRYSNRVVINAALTSATWDEFDTSIVDLAVEVGAREIGVVVDFDPTFYSTRGTQSIIDRLWSVIDYGRQNGVVLTGYWHQIFQVMLGYDTVSERGFKNCSAKGAQLSIEPNGSVFSCKAGSTRLGSIESGAGILDSEAYLDHAKLRRQNPAFCKGCEIEGFCAGLCLGPLEKKYAAIDVVEPSACDFYRGITRQHIRALQPYEIPTFDMHPERFGGQE